MLEDRKITQEEYDAAIADAGHARHHRAEHRLPDRGGQRLLLRLRHLDHQEPVRRPRHARRQRGSPDAQAAAASRSTRRSTSTCRTRPRRRSPRTSRHRPAHSTSERSPSRCSPAPAASSRWRRTRSTPHDPEVIATSTEYTSRELQHRLRLRRIQRPPARLDVQGLHPRRVAQRGALAQRDLQRLAPHVHARSPTAARHVDAAATTRTTTTAAPANNAVDATTYSVNIELHGDGTAARPLQDQADRRRRSACTVPTAATRCSTNPSDVLGTEEVAPLTHGRRRSRASRTTA